MEIIEAKNNEYTPILLEDYSPYVKFLVEKGTYIEDENNKSTHLIMDCYYEKTELPKSGVKRKRGEFYS